MIFFFEIIFLNPLRNVFLCSNFFSEKTERENVAKRYRCFHESNFKTRCKFFMKPIEKSMRGNYFLCGLKLLFEEVLLKFFRMEMQENFVIFIIKCNLSCIYSCLNKFMLWRSLDSVVFLYKLWKFSLIYFL